MMNKEKINLKSIIAALIILAVGIFLALMDVFKWKSPYSIVLNIGCSFVSSALVAIVTVLLVERQKVSPVEEWKIKKIYGTRAEINNECSIKLKKAKYKVDVVAFGLQSFRNKQSSEIENYLKKGVNFRILTMNPNSEFVTARESEEDNTNIKNSIEKLIEWADKLNSKNYKGKIIIKGYSCMTLDFYWRVDDTIYVGPYWYGYDSQQTITYKFEADGQGFDLYEEYFEKLWNDNVLTDTLTKIAEFRKKKTRG